MAAGLILASASRARRDVLNGAGVAHEIHVAGIDEAPIKAACRSEGVDAETAALRLAAAKAAAVGQDHPDNLVIGADQILVCDGAWFDKPADVDALRGHIGSLQGRTHHLVNGLVVAEGTAVVWRFTDRIAMTMRPLDGAAIDAYIAAAGPEALESVGGYRLEGPGAQLFEKTEGDFFSILGLPLLPLLAYLRQRGALAI